MARKQEPKVMEAIEPHCVDLNGNSWTVSFGERLLSDHPAVVQNPQYFVESSHGGVTRPRLVPEEPKPPPRLSNPEPRVRAKCHMKFRGIALPGGLLGAGMTYIDAGDLVPRSHPAVNARPENFEPVP
jgi:hypothetical protein